MSLIVKKNVKKYEKIYSNGQNHIYPNLDLVRIEKIFLKNHHGKTLDFGFGSGENLIFLTKAGHETFGLETSHSVFKLVKKKLIKRKIKSKIEILKNHKKLPYKDKFFDNIVCLSVLSQLKTKKNVIHLLKEFKRILKINGNLIIDLNGPKSLYFFQKKDFYSIKSKKDFLKLLKQAKFKSLYSGEVFTSYFNIQDHEYISIAKNY